MRSGLTVHVKDQGEWLIYNDIFVDGEYDVPLEEALQPKPPKNIVTIVDIGANVGFYLLLHGLVRQCQGNGMIVEKPFHAMNRVDILARSKESSVQVPYINLTMELADLSEIDLLKCDIEGSELDFLESSPELFAKVRHAVFELHDDNCDTQKCRRILTELGFSHCQRLRHEPGKFSLEFFSR